MNSSPSYEPQNLISRLGVRYKGGGLPLGHGPSDFCLPPRTGVGLWASSSLAYSQREKRCFIQ